MTNEQAKKYVKKKWPLDHQVIFDSSYPDKFEYYAIVGDSNIHTGGVGNSWEKAIAMAERKYKQAIRERTAADKAEGGSK